MIIRRGFPRWRRPAAGQLSFWFIDSPEPIYWTPPQPPQRSWPRRRSDIPSFRPRRARSDPRPFQNRVEWQVDRWARRRASCALCSRWPAPCDHQVGARLLVVCRACEAKEDTPARLRELVTVDWAELSPVPSDDAGSVG
jgi:hypothetical protein